MSQIRRQPRRKNKKYDLQLKGNLFQQCLPYLPPRMVKKIQSLDKIIFTHLDELLTEPELDLNENLILIKQALKRQQTLTNELKDEKKEDNEIHNCESVEQPQQLLQLHSLEEEFSSKHNILIDYIEDVQFWTRKEEDKMNFFDIQ